MILEDANKLVVGDIVKRDFSEVLYTYKVVLTREVTSMYTKREWVLENTRTGRLFIKDDATILDYLKYKPFFKEGGTYRWNAYNTGTLYTIDSLLVTPKGANYAVALIVTANGDEDYMVMDEYDFGQMTEVK